MTQLSTAANIESAPAHGVSFAEALRVWTRVALLSFGGPTAQIAVMHRIIVDEKHWISESRFLYALNYCMLLPGPKQSSSQSISAGSCIGRLAGLLRAASS
jgi:chromate transporter